MIDMTPKFVTIDDFDNYWGRHLRDLLRTTDGNTNQADAFLYRVEVELMNFIDAKTFRNVRYDELSDYQLNQFKLAILEQAMYRFKEGENGLDSGYDRQRGMVATASELERIRICRPAIEYLKVAGLFNLVMRNKPRTLRGYAGLYNFNEEVRGK